MSARNKERISKIEKTLKSFPDWPKPGIIFRDIFPLFRSPDAVDEVISIFEDEIKAAGAKIDIIVGLDARGFLFGPLLCQKLRVPFVPVRKNGKLPGPCVQQSYNLEYGSDCFEMQEGAIEKGQKVVIIDDLLATGGTMNAACSLVAKQGGDVTLCLVLVELVDLKGRDKCPANILSLIQYEGE